MPLRHWCLLTHNISTMCYYDEINLNVASDIGHGQYVQYLKLVISCKGVFTLLSNKAIVIFRYCT